MTDSFGSPIDSNMIKSDEKLLSLFSHLSLFLGGIWLPLIFWLTNKDKSKFITFHALQALWFHLAYVVLIVVVGIFLIVGGAGISIITSTGKSGEPPVFMIIAIIAFYALIFVFIFAGIGYSVFMGIKSYQGNLNKYPIIGKMVYNRVYGVNV